MRIQPYLQPPAALQPENLDAFGRLRVSNPVTLFDTQLQYDLHEILWQTKITNNSGSATETHLPNESAALLTVGDNDNIVRQSRQYLRYQPGKSQLIMMTFSFGVGAAGVVQSVGYFDDSNGVFFRRNNSTNEMVLRSNTSGTPSETVISQTNWNIDRLDGDGRSGITLDSTASQIFITDLEWLGVGTVRVGFVIDGEIVYVHSFHNANALITVYMTTGNLPLRYEITSGVTGSTHAMRCICSQVTSEGGANIINGLAFTASNTQNLRNVGNATLFPLLSIRPKSLYNGIVNRAFLELEDFSLYSQDQSIFYKLIYGATLTGAVWNDVNTNSLMEFDVASTSITGGIDILDNYLAAVSSGNSGGFIQKDIASRIPLALDIDGNHPTAPYTDAFTIVAISLINTTNCGASIGWKELR